MKDIFENSETFTAYATINAGKYMFQEMLKKMQKVPSPQKKMVDAATGYDKHKYQECIKSAIIILEDVIEAKKVIEADYKTDEEMIADLKKLLTKYHN